MVDVSVKDGSQVCFFIGIICKLRCFCIIIYRLLYELVNGFLIQEILVNLVVLVCSLILVFFVIGKDVYVSFCCFKLGINNIYFILNLIDSDIFCNCQFYIEFIFKFAGIMNGFDKKCLIYLSIGKMIVFFRLIWSLFLFFILLYLFVNYFVVISVVMEIFNQVRFYILVYYYFQIGEVFFFQEVNYKELVLWSKCSMNWDGVGLWSKCSMNRDGVGLW